ncbi:MAG: hypothetical protein WKG01_04790 [Kofleriaceae bacterium]
MRRSRALAPSAMLVLLVLASSTAIADRPRPIPIQQPVVQVSCDYLEVQATTGKASASDAGLKPIEKKLKKGPFKQWNEFKLLSSGQRALKKSKAEAIALKQGNLSAMLIEIVDKSKIRLRLEIENAKGKQVSNNTTLLDAGDWVITTVSQPNGDGHLTALTCK